MYLVDTLSRAYLPTTARSPTEEETELIHAVEFLPISEPQLAEIQCETAADSVLQWLTQYYKAGQIRKKSYPQNYIPTSL